MILGSSAALAARVRAGLLDANVQSRESHGVVTLKVETGIITIRTAAPLPAGAAVTLDVTRSGDQFVARVSAPVSTGARNATSPTAATDTTAVPLGAQQSTPDIARRTIPSTTTAVVLTPTSPPIAGETDPPPSATVNVTTVPLTGLPD